MGYNRIQCELYQTEGKALDLMVRDVLMASARKQRVVRLIFFMSCTDNEEYLTRKEELKKLAAEYFKSPHPLISLVAQKPLTGELLLEVHTLKVSDPVEVREIKTSSGHYLRIEADDYCEIIAGGISGDCPDSSVCSQSEQAFQKAGEILKAENMEWGDIVRQWNYLERITDFSGHHQRYQEFNEVRSHYYSASRWLSGYPAATGIGTQAGGIQIDFNAVKGNVSVVPLDNDWQTAAHIYSDDVLISCDIKKETPKFERAKLLSVPGYGVVYISGTAAIRGEGSVTQGGVLDQAGITMENILHLIGMLPCHVQMESLRVYLKNEEDVLPVREWMDRTYPGIAVSYLCAEICRRELLIEMEGVASI